MRLVADVLLPPPLRYRCSLSGGQMGAQSRELPQGHRRSSKLGGRGGSLRGHPRVAEKWHAT